MLLLCAGSSTACVLVVNGTTLSASNLGDSGFVLVRDGAATFQCPQQQHNFNFPFQLGSADSMSDQPQAAMVRQQHWCVFGAGEPGTTTSLLLLYMSVWVVLRELLS
jgi:hypothetical protein